MKHMTFTAGLRWKPAALWLFFTLISVSGAFGQLAFWDPTGSTNFGVSPFPATTANANLTVTPLVRGAGVTTSGTAAAGGWGGTGWTGEATDEFTWNMTANTGYQQSLSTFDLRYRRSSSGTPSGTLQYAINGGAYTAISTLSFSSTSTSGANIPQVSLSGIAALQNVPAGTTVNFRILFDAGTLAGGTFYIYTGGTLGMRIGGTVTVAAVPCTAPAGLNAGNVTASTADLSWGSVAGATGYEFVVDQSSADPVGAGTATGSTTYNATGLNALTTYYLHVRTDCGSGNFSPWTTISFTTLVAPCDAPTGLTAANVTHESADLSWNAQNGVAGYEYVVDQVSADPAGAGTATASTTYNASGLNELTTYYLHVRTDCGGGNWSPWTTISFTTVITPCDAPTGLNAANVTHESADLSWDSQSGVAGYEFVVDQLSADPVGSGTATVSTTYNATGLNELTTYYLHVRTDCGSGNWSPWTTISFTTVITPCDAPTGLTAANVTHESADLSWDAQSGVAGYEFVVDQLSADPAGAGTATASTTYNAAGLNELTTYYLHVRTDCGGGNWSPWTTISFTTVITPCDAPTGLNAANVTHESADLSWDPQSGVAGYEFVVDQLSADPAGAGTATVSTSYSTAGLNELTTYYLHVRTDCSGGNWSPWTTISFTTVITPCDAPTGLNAANVTHESADLSWTAQGGAAGYEFVVDQLSADPAGAGTATASTNYNAIGLNELTTYYLHVRTDCGGGNWSPWTTISFTTVITPCDAPTGLNAANVTHESADLSWTAQGGAAGYEFVVDQLSADPAGAGTATASTTYNATGLNELTTYYLHVRTDCGGGNWSPWTTIAFTTTVAPCDPATGLTAANVTTTSADLSWDPQSGVNGYEYVVDQSSADPAGAGTSIGTNAVNIGTLVPNTTCYLHVRVSCGSNFSDWTTIPFTTLDDAGINETASLPLEVYPNPATDQLTVQTPLAGGHIVLQDLNGKTLLTQEMNGTLILSVSELESGVYLLMYENNGAAAVRRIVKE